MPSPINTTHRELVVVVIGFVDRFICLLMLMLLFCLGDSVAVAVENNDDTDAVEYLRAVSFLVVVVAVVAGVVSPS